MKTEEEIVEFISAGDPVSWRHIERFAEYLSAKKLWDVVDQLERSRKINIDYRHRKGGFYRVWCKYSVAEIDLDVKHYPAYGPWRVTMNKRMLPRHFINEPDARDFIRLLMHHLEWGQIIYRMLVRGDFEMKANQGILYIKEVFSA